jgi:uncharacterized protein (DUF2141 family)
VKARLRLLGACACAIALSACASAPPKPEEPRPPGRGTVRVTVTGFPNEKGQALVALFLSAKGWPNDVASAFGRIALPIRNGEAVAEFEDVPSGPFAVSAFHDKDADRVLDTDLLGIPSEDYGFSRDARSTFGPPDFEAARLDLAAGETKQVTIRVK